MGPGRDRTKVLATPVSAVGLATDFAMGPGMISTKCLKHLIQHALAPFLYFFLSI